MGNPESQPRACTQCTTEGANAKQANALPIPGLLGGNLRVGSDFPPEHPSGPVPAPTDTRGLEGSSRTDKVPGGSRRATCMFENLDQHQAEADLFSPPRRVRLEVPGEPVRAAYVQALTERLALVYWPAPNYVVHTWVPVEWLS